MKGKWLLFPGRSGPLLSAVGSSKGSEKVTEQGQNLMPWCLVAGGGGEGWSLEPEPSMSGAVGRHGPGGEATGRAGRGT